MTCLILSIVHGTTVSWHNLLLILVGGPLQIARSLFLTELFELEPKQLWLGAAYCGSFISIFGIEHIAAVVKSLDNLLAFGFIVVVLGQAVFFTISDWFSAAYM